MMRAHLELGSVHSAADYENVKQTADSSSNPILCVTQCLPSPVVESLPAEFAHPTSNSWTKPAALIPSSALLAFENI